MAVYDSDFVVGKSIAKIDQLFDGLFCNKTLFPLIPNDIKLSEYNIFTKYTTKPLNVVKNPAILGHIKTMTFQTECAIKNRRDHKLTLRLDELNVEYVYFILNAIRFSDIPKSKKRSLIKSIGLYEVSIDEDFYNMVIYDIRAKYYYDNVIDPKLRYKPVDTIIENGQFYHLENLYYMNKFKRFGYFDNDKNRKAALKLMKETQSMTSNQLAKFNTFVGPKFSKLCNVMDSLGIKYYITGSIIDYMNNTTMNPNNYVDSDIDIVITDKIKFQVLSGILVATYANENGIPIKDVMNNNIVYDIKYINIAAGVYSDRPIQMYYAFEKYSTFAHHFPCVRGYINNKGNISLSKQAVDIFRPDSDKVIKYVFMFPYTDTAKAKAIIEKYRKRGYVIKE